MMASKMPKIRISEITAFVVFVATCGFFPGLQRCRTVLQKIAFNTRIPTI